MKDEILYAPSYAMARLELAPGESVTVESGAMVGMSPGLDVKTSIGGNSVGFFGKLLAFLIALARKFMGGESFFMNTYTATGEPGTLYIAPTLVGDLVALDIEPGRGMLIQGGSYVASTGQVSLKTRWAGLFKSMFSGEGSFMLEASGSGRVWVNAYGGIQEIEVNGEFICDNGHMVAFDDGLDYSLTTAGGLLTSMTSGEGLVMRFQGKGRLLIQSRNLPSLVSWVIPSLPE